MKRIRKAVEKLLLYGFFILGVVLLFYGTGRVSTMILSFESFIAAILLAWLFEIRKVNPKYLIYIYLALWFNMFGELAAYYNGGILYDKFLHFGLGILLSAIVLEYFKNNSKLEKDMVFLNVLGMLALWEIYEYALDVFFGFRAQGVYQNNILIQSALDDTLYDLMLGALGSLLYLFFKKEKVDVAIKRTVKKEEIKFSTFLKNHLKW